MDTVTLRIDLHVHTKWSRDALNSISDINRRCRELSLDGYGVCDHDSIGALAKATLSSDSLTVIPGLEVSARGAHILCLDPSDLIPSKLSITETVEKIHDQGATAVLAHPYGIPRSFVDYKKAIKAKFDAVEVANAAQTPFSLIMAWNRGLAEKLGLPQTGGSDSHIPETFGRAYTIVEAASQDPLDVIEAIRRGRTSTVGSGTRLDERMKKFWRVLREK